jgi:hypothetical protein
MLAKWRKPAGEEEDPDAKETSRVMTVADAAAVLEEINCLDLNKTPKGKEDARGAAYVGLHTELVLAKDVATPNEDWNQIPDTQKLHQVSTTITPGKLLIRKQSCFICPACEDRDFLNCTWMQELGPVAEFTMTRLHTHIAGARAETRTRSGQDLHRHALAGLAEEGSVIAVDFKDNISLVLVTGPLGSGQFNDDMKGRVLKQLEQPNRFSSTNSRIKKFDAGFVRSPPLTAQKKVVGKGKKKFSEFEINECDFLSLRNEFLS